MMQAETIAGLCVKALVIAWFHRDTPPDLGCYGNALDVRLAQSILMDLVRLIGEQPAGERLSQIQRLVEASQAVPKRENMRGGSQDETNPSHSACRHRRSALPRNRHGRCCSVTIRSRCSYRRSLRSLA